MSARRMHADEIVTDSALVRRLLHEQFPSWATLPLAPVPSAGTDHALYRLGADLVVRLPRIPGPVAQAEKEFRWLPKLAPHLPLAIPEPLARGAAGAGYPFPWSVYRWLPGAPATGRSDLDLEAIAVQLAAFLQALQRIDATSGPLPGEHNGGRGEPLVARDAATRRTLPTLPAGFDISRLLRIWDEAVAAPPWDAPPALIHGDLLSGNLLVERGRLNAVIDFGCLGVGDPAVDLLPAWTLLTPATRPAFRAALGVDDAAWQRGRGWALSWAVIALPYYVETNLILAGIARYALAQVLADHPA